MFKCTCLNYLWLFHQLFHVMARSLEQLLGGCRDEGTGQGGGITSSELRRFQLPSHEEDCMWVLCVYHVSQMFVRNVIYRRHILF